MFTVQVDSHPGIFLGLRHNDIMNISQKSNFEISIPK